MTTKIPKFNIEHFKSSSSPSGSFSIFEFPSPDVLADALEHSTVKGNHTHSFYTIFWVARGWCCQSIDGISYKLQPGSLLIITPSQLHTNIIECSADLSGAMMMFTSDMLSSPNNDGPRTGELLLLSTIYSSPILELSGEDNAAIFSTISSIQQEYSYSSQSIAAIKSLFSAMMIQIERATGDNFASKGGNVAVDIYKRFISLLESRYKENLSVEDYASALGLSSKHLNRTLRKISGKSTSESIMERKLLEAKRLLLYSSMSVLQIVDELNYSDSPYFNRIFKRSVGVSPNVYRKQMS